MRVVYRLVIPCAVLVAGLVYAQGVEGTLRTVRMDGIGAVRVGMTLAEARRALGTEFSLEFTTDPNDQECFYATPKSQLEGVSIMVQFGTVARIDVVGSGIRTPEGIGVGSREMEIVTAYGDRVRSRPNPYSGQDFEVSSTDGQSKFVFEVDDGSVQLIRAGRQPEVDYIERCL